MSQRHEFLMLFEQDGVNRRELCRRFGVSPTIGYRLWARYRGEGKAGLVDRSRRPQRSPGRSSVETEALVLAVRDEHPAWGGRKIRRRLQDLGQRAPGASTITAILHRHGRIDAAVSTQHRAFERFERAGTVQAELTAIFRRYGLPDRMLTDNGAPWGPTRCIAIPG